MSSIIVGPSEALGIDVLLSIGTTPRRLAYVGTCTIGNLSCQIVINTATDFMIQETDNTKSLSCFKIIHHPNE